MKTIKSPHASHRTHPRQRVRLTERDLRLFGYIGQTGLASQAQLHHAYWPHAQRQTAVDRLARLEKAGYLRSLTTSARGARETCYYLTHAATRTFGARRAASLGIGAPSATEIAHLLRTRAVLDVLAHAHRLVSFTSERLLKREAAKAARTHQQTPLLANGSRMWPHQVCDGRLVLREGEQNATVLLEIDGAYFGKRLRVKIAALARERQRVLWVTKSGERADLLRALCADHPHIQPVAFADLEQYLDHHVDYVDPESRQINTTDPLPAVNAITGTISLDDHDHGHA